MIILFLHTFFSDISSNDFLLDLKTNCSYTMETPRNRYTAEEAARILIFDDNNE